MNRKVLLTKLVLVVALTVVSLTVLAQPAHALPKICAIACSNPYGGSCSAITCICDAAGGALKRCTECSDNDYHCPGMEIYCHIDIWGNKFCYWI